MAYIRQHPHALSLGDVDAAATAEITEAEYRRRMLAAQEKVADWQRQWVINDRRARMVQIAATLSIPLAGVVWKWFLGRRVRI